MLAAPPLLIGTAEASDVSPVSSSDVFHHGVASGDPLSDRVILWTRISRTGSPTEIPVDYVMAADPQMQTVLATGSAVATRTNDYTVKVDVTGLTPATTYYYQFTSGGVKSPVGRTRTLPVGSVDRLRIAVVSCAALAHGYFNAYRRVSRRADLDLVVHVGDYIYEHGDGEYGNVRAYKPSHEILTLLDYRTRHNQYKTDIDVREIHRQHPMIAIWDDHEIADNAWKAGAENHQAEEGSYTDRLAAALRSYYEWMPVRPVSTERRKLYRSFRIGDLAELFMVESRLTGRDEQVPPNIASNPPQFTEEGEFLDPARKMIPDSEQKWLVDGLRASTAQWKLIGQGTMLAPARNGKDFDGNDVFFNNDQWDGYKPARDRLLAAIAGSSSVPAVRNAVVLTGDIHSSWANELPMDPYGAYEDTGQGSLAVEFVTTSVTSPGFDDADGSVAAGLRALNKHIKYCELEKHGYLLLDINSSRLSAEWWYVDQVLQKSTIQNFGTAVQVLDGSNRLEEGFQTLPRPGAPALAP